jgi:protein-L-isoaspartate(D-aspartate) O-methyltransferase
MGPYKSKGLNRPEITNTSVLVAMSRVPRHMFVPEDLIDRAYEDRALPIGSGQTISQPFIVALMTQAANIKSGDKVLEIGTGSGYQAAVLAELGVTVFSIEIVPALSARARELLHNLNYGDKISLRVGDGYTGWEEEAPFDAILVTAAAPSPPKNLLTQLKDNGCLVIPVEDRDKNAENLLLFQRSGDDFISHNLGPVKFVPLIGEARSTWAE